jgi:DNA-binding response OmpR family regulator
MASVLVIDDNQGTLETYSTVLHFAGYETATALQGRAGIELALCRGFDVHLVDLRLPDMSGLDVVRLLRRQGVSGRVVLVTVFGAFE